MRTEPTNVSTVGIKKSIRVPAHPTGQAHPLAAFVVLGVLLLHVVPFGRTPELECAGVVGNAREEALQRVQGLLVLLEPEEALRLHVLQNRLVGVLHTLDKNKRRVKTLR